MARYFTEEEFKNEMEIDRVGLVLKQLYSAEDVTPDQEHCIEFFMMSDTLDKLDEMDEVLEGKGYDVDGVEKHTDGCELIAVTTPMKMDVKTVSNWYEKLWKEGYQLDCKLDGWHVLVD